MADDMRAITVRLSDRGEQRLNRGLRITGKGQKELIEDAIAHYVGTIEMGLPVYVVPPSELKAEEPK